MDGSIDTQVRLGVDNKRQLFQTLLAIVERLFYLNKFPVDQEDFALSLQSPEVEAAWRLLSTTDRASLSPSTSQQFLFADRKWRMHLYKPVDNRVFMSVKPIDLCNARRYTDTVANWCTKQARLEDQMLRAAKTIKAIVHSCNTVGQYKRVSPDLLGFLPSEYRDALRQYTKKSPYPQISATQQEIDTTIATLAYAVLQPAHPSEERFLGRPYWKGNRYRLDCFPRSRDYDRNDVRRLQL